MGPRMLQSQPRPLDLPLGSWLLPALLCQGTDFEQMGQVAKLFAAGSGIKPHTFFFLHPDSWHCQALPCQGTA